jgi:hypothetical protein
VLCLVRGVLVCSVRSPAGPRELPDPGREATRTVRRTVCGGPAQGAAIQDHVHPEPQVITCAITHRSHTMSHRASDVNIPGHDLDHFFIATVVAA